MSVLVEAPSLILRRAALDVRYPGGMHAFLGDVSTPQQRALRVCVDSHLASVSFLLPTHARAVARRLETLGFPQLVEDRSAELAVIGQDFESSITTEWMEWRRHANGCAHAWLAGCEPGDLSAPDGWDFDRAQRFVPDLSSDERMECVRIAVEKRLETWLDLRTGELVTRGAQEGEVAVPVTPAHPAPPVADTPTCTEPLMPVVLSALIGANASYQSFGATAVGVTFHDAHGFYWHRLDIDEVTRTIGCRCTLGTHVPEAQRGAVAELLARLENPSNGWELSVDPDDGWVSVQTYIGIKHPICTTRAIYEIIATVKDFVARHHDAIMRVAFGGMSPYEFPNPAFSPDDS